MDSRKKIDRQHQPACWVLPQKSQNIPQYSITILLSDVIRHFQLRLYLRADFVSMTTRWHRSWSTSLLPSNRINTGLACGVWHRQHRNVVDAVPWAIQLNSGWMWMKRICMWKGGHVGYYLLPLVEGHPLYGGRQHERQWLGCPVVTIVAALRELNL